VTLAARQALLAELIDDEAVERAVREDPDAVAAARGIDVRYVRWLAALEPRRVRSFRRSRVVKERRRRGE